MKVIIDTNSLLSLVRYYLPFDKNGDLFEFLKEKFVNGEIIIIDKVYEQCSYISKGIILKEIFFLNDKAFLKKIKLPYKTDNLLVPDSKKFYHFLHNDFVNSDVKKSRNLSDEEFENLKNKYLEDADMKQIILCLNLKDKEDIVLVTEETSTNNDNKLFKKIPYICKKLGIKTYPLPDLLKEYHKEGLEIVLKK